MSRTTACVAACLLAGAGTAHANHDLNTSFRAGSIALPSIDGSASDGDAAGAEQGRVSYRVPIVSPPGRPGLEPDLALVYSGRGDGVAGAGWSLTVPSIAVKTSGRGGQPTWGVEETYLGFGGEALIAAGTLADQDGDGVDEQVFREERDLAYIRYLALSGGGWRADYPDGRKLTLGTTTAARIERAATGWVARWLPEVLEDPSGHQLAYTWSTAQEVDAGAVSPTQRYLTAIRWACQPCDGAAAFQELRVSYGRRADLGAAPVLDFGPGFLVETELYVSAITTASAGTHPGDVRTYALGYDGAGTRLRLTSVEVTTADAALPAITFAYTTPSPQATQPEALAGAPGVQLEAGVQPMDLDKDGRVDLVDLSTLLAPKVYGNTGATGAAFAAVGTAIASPPAALPTAASVSVEDENRDLGLDVFDLGAARVYRHQGSSGWDTGATVAALPAVAFGADTVRADVDLDGYPDLIDTSKATHWTIYFNDGAGDYTSDVVDCVGTTTPQIASVLHAHDAGVLFGDVNGDGLLDVTYVDAAGDAYAFPGRGRQCWGYLPEDGHGADAFDTLTVTSIGGLPQPGSLQMADVDGDGFADLVELASSRLGAWRLVPGEGWRDVDPAGPWTQTISATDGCRIADFDHDGISEVLCSAGWTLYDFADQLPDLLASVDNGRGIVTTFEYTTSARVAADHAAAGTPWTTNVAAAVPVVARIEERDGRGHLLERSFDYRDAYYVTDELEDRYEFVGFGYVAERRTPWLEVGGVRGIDPSDGGVLSRRFYDVGSVDWHLRGMPVCEETWPGDATPTGHACAGDVGPLVAVTREYAVTIDPTWGFATVQRDAEDRYVAEGTGTPARLRTEWLHDDVGNALRVVEYGRYRAGAPLYGDDQRATATDWITDETAWNLRLPARIRRGRITSTGGFTAMTIEHRLYDGASTWNVASVGAGLLTEVRSWVRDPIAGTAALITTETRSYDATGRLIATTDAAGAVTTYAYDASLGLFVVREELDPAGLALVQELETDSRTGAELRRVAPDGTVTEAGYDLLGRMVWLARPGDTPAAPTITRAYVDAAPISTRVDVSADGTADGLVVVHHVDGHGRVVCEEREGPAAGVDVTQRDFTARGHLALELAPYRAAACDPLTVTVSGGVGARSTTRDRDLHVVDALGRPVALVHGDGTMRTWRHDVLTVTEADEEDTAAGSIHAGTPTVRHHDGLGRVIAVDEEHLALDDDPGVHTTTYDYDALGNLTAVTDASGNVIFQAIYDSRSRRVRSIDADLGQRDTTYDALDRPLTITDARGATVTMTWDLAGRIATTTTSEGVTTYHYDDHPDPGLTATCHTAGRLAWVDDPSGSEVRCYDAHGNPVQVDKVVDAHGVTPMVTFSAFDRLDRLTSVTYPDGTIVSYTHGDDGRVATVTATSGGFAFPLATLSHRASGQVSTVALGNGVDLIRTYDARQRPLRLRAEGTSTWQDLTYAYDGVGNVVAITDAVGEESATFAYDDLYRLVSATGDRFAGETATYRYDRLGNLTRKESTDATSPVHLGALTYGDPVKVHAVTAAGGATFAYDAAGHLIDDGALAFTWTDRGYLAEVADAITGTTLYSVVYDHADRRVFKADASGDTVVYVPAAGAELRTVGGVATWIKRVSVSGLELARIDGSFTAVDVAAHVSFPIVDHLGTPGVVLDGAGVVIERASTHPWGEENTASLAAAGTLGDYRDPADPTTTLERRFQGREIDPLLGGYDFGARMYRPDLGRFMSPDTVVPEPLEGQSWNRYAFVRNNPLRYVDPTGHTEVEAATTTATDALPCQPDCLGSDQPGRQAYAIPDAPPSEWEHVGGGDGVQWRELADAGNDTLGEEYLDPLLSVKSVKGKASIEYGSVSAEVDHQGNAKVGVQHSVPLPGGLKAQGKCTSAPGCDVAVKTDSYQVGPAAVSGTWKPAQDEVSVAVGPQMNLGPGLKAKLVVEAVIQYSRETAYRYGYRLWNAMTEDHTVAE